MVWMVWRWIMRTCVSYIIKYAHCYFLDLIRIKVFYYLRCNSTVWIYLVFVIHMFYVCLAGTVHQKTFSLCKMPQQMGSCITPLVHNDLNNDKLQANFVMIVLIITFTQYCNCYGYHWALLEFTKCTPFSHSIHRMFIVNNYAKTNRHILGT